MWQGIKVWGFRKYYRYTCAHSWKGHSTDSGGAALEIPGEAGPIHARMYSHGGSPEKPFIVYFHGGGWVIGDLDTHTPFCNELSKRSGCTVISVDYRLAPEHPFPAAQDDCLAATRWIAEHSGDFGPSNHKLVLAGDSAGANLATCACLETEPALSERISGELILYPVTDHYKAGFPSYVEKARGQALTAGFMFFFWDTYLAGCAHDSAAAARAMPLRSNNIAALPPTLLVTAEDDPLRDEGIAYAEKLRTGGVPLHYHHFDTAAHGFACSEGPNDNFRRLMDEIVAWLDTLEAKP